MLRIMDRGGSVAAVIYGAVVLVDGQDQEPVTPTCRVISGDGSVVALENVSPAAVIADADLVACRGVEGRIVGVHPPAVRSVVGVDSRDPGQRQVTFRVAAGVGSSEVWLQGLSPASAAELLSRAGVEPPASEAPAEDAGG